MIHMSASAQNIKIDYVIASVAFFVESIAFRKLDGSPLALRNLVYLANCNLRRENTVRVAFQNARLDSLSNCRVRGSLMKPKLVGVCVLIRISASSSYAELNCAGLWSYRQPKQKDILRE